MDYSVSPADGRNMGNKAQVIRDFKQGKDFVNHSQPITGGGRYMSFRDLKVGESAKIYWKGPLDDAYVIVRKGEIKPGETPKQRDCRVCGGDGWADSMVTVLGHPTTECKFCNGTGKTS